MGSHRRTCMRPLRGIQGRLLYIQVRVPRSDGQRVISLFGSFWDRSTDKPVFGDTGSRWANMQLRRHPAFRVFFLESIKERVVKFWRDCRVPVCLSRL